jgi:hypothetical protein
MVHRESFNKPVAGLLCPLCLSKNYSLVAKRDPEHGIRQTVYLCADCRSYFGDAREFDGGGPGRS